MEEKLREEDVTRLLDSPDGEVRAEIAGKIAAQHPGLTEHERKLAEDIFRIMVKDAEVRVRQALARQLKDNPLLPHDLAITLARDVDEVALPILQFSEVLSDQDLIDLVQSQGRDKQEAVARRSHVSAQVADALVKSGDHQVVAVLVANQGVELSEATLTQVVDQFSSTDQQIGDALAGRPGLPVTVVERLLAHVSENIRVHLLGRADLLPDVATALLIQAREMAVLGITNSETDVVKLVDHLERHGRLTPSIILRAVCIGDMTFFEVALAKLARITVENAHTLIYDEGKRGFQALYEKAELPETLYRAMLAAIDVARVMKYDGEPHDRERFSRRMIERILTQYGEEGVEFKNDDLEYLLARMSQLTPAATAG